MIVERKEKRGEIGRERGKREKKGKGEKERKAKGHTPIKLIAARSAHLLVPERQGGEKF
jgi:hypothetical protein